MLDSEWSALNHTHLTSDKEWDPRLCNHDIDKDWDADLEDPVEKHHKDQPHNGFGHAKAKETDNDDDENGEPTTRAEIEANLTSLVKDELVGSVIECEIDGEIFHRDLSDDDEECDWGDWRQVNRSQWHSYDVEGR